MTLDRRLVSPRRPSCLNLCRQALFPTPKAPGVSSWVETRNNPHAVNYNLRCHPVRVTDRNILLRHVHPVHGHCNASFPPPGLRIPSPSPLPTELFIRSIDNNRPTHRESLRLFRPLANDNRQRPPIHADPETASSALDALRHDPSERFERGSLAGNP